MATKFKVGEWVEVRSKEEILRTLDEKGCIDGMPFMPEMLQYCGQRFQVYKSAHKTCDYSTPYPFYLRRLENTVHLQTRCDGSAHDGCQAGCLLYWKEDWLKATGKTAVPTIQRSANGNSAGALKCSEKSLHDLVKINTATDPEPIYVCQITEVPRATTALNWWDVRQYVQDWLSGNVPFSRLITSLIYSSYYHLTNAGFKVGKPMRWLYDHVGPFLGTTKFPRTPGRIPVGQPTPTSNLGLQPGELVRVKSHDDILNTVAADNKNRGMFWDAELVPYCGGTYKVAKRVTKLIGEQTRKMVEMKTACIILENVVCRARYSDCRMQCPKEMYPYWREVWLERVGPAPAASDSANKEDGMVASEIGANL